MNNALKKKVVRQNIETAIYGAVTPAKFNFFRDNGSEKYDKKRHQEKLKRIKQFLDKWITNGQLSDETINQYYRHIVDGAELKIINNKLTVCNQEQMQHRNFDGDYTITK